MTRHALPASIKVLFLTLLVLTLYIPFPVVRGQDFEQDADSTPSNAETPLPLHDGEKLLAAGSHDVFSSSETLTIPSSVDEIVADAFNGYSELKIVRLERGIRIVSSHAFADCQKLSDVYLFDSVEQISDDAFPQNVTLHSTSASYAEQWAKRQGVAFQEHSAEELENAVRLSVNETPGAIIFHPLPTGVEIVQITGRDVVSGNIVVPDAVQGSPVVKLGDGLLADWPKLTSATLPRGLKEIGNRVFEGCRELTSINLPDGLTTIGSGAFSRCYSLKEIALPPSIRSIEDETFQGCVNLRAVKLPDNLDSVGVRAFYDCGSMTELTLPSTLATIHDAAFGHCYALSSLELPERLATLGSRSFASNICLLVKPGSSAFNQAVKGGYKYATAIFVPNNVAGVESFFWRLSGAGAEINGVALTDDFKGDLTLPEKIADLPVVGVGDQAFVEITSLRNVTLPDSVQRIGESAFSGCTELVSIHFPQSLRAIEKGAFANCPLLETPAFPEKLEWIGPKAFVDCGQLGALQLGNNVRLIGEKAFWGCENLSEATLPESLTIIGTQAFAYCDHLKTLALPSLVTHIGDDAFPEQVVLKVVPGSRAEEWAKNKNVHYVY